LFPSAIFEKDKRVSGWANTCRHNFGAGGIFEIQRVERVMTMKKFLNRPEDFVDEMIKGIIAAHPDQLTYVENDLRCIR
jgi:hypothetical protein